MPRLDRRACSTVLQFTLHQMPMQPFACAAPARAHSGMSGTQALCPAPRCHMQPLKPVWKVKVPGVAQGTLLHKACGWTHRLLLSTLHATVSGHCMDRAGRNRDPSHLPRGQDPHQ